MVNPFFYSKDKLVKLYIYVCVCVYVSIPVICAGQSMRTLSRANYEAVQKRNIDTKTFTEWPLIESPVMSNNGTYFGYTLSKEEESTDKLVVVDSNGRRILESPINGWFSFTMSSRFVVCLNLHDSLCIGRLDNLEWQYIGGVRSFQLIGDYVLFQKAKSPTEILLLDTERSRTIKVLNVATWFRCAEGNTILLLQNDSMNKQILYLLNLESGKKLNVWSGKGFRSQIMDRTGGQVIIATDSSRVKLWYFKKGARRAVSLQIPDSIKLDLSRIGRFSNDGRHLFLNIIEGTSTLKSHSVMKIWSYLDTRLESQELSRMQNDTRLASFQLSGCKLISLDSSNDWLFMPRFNDSVALIRHQREIISGTEINWNLKGTFYWSLVSIKNGGRKELEHCTGSRVVELSPSGKYVIYFDINQKQYFVYESGTGKRRCLTEGIEEKWEKDVYRGSYGRYIGGWEIDDKAVIVYGERDIWRLDPAGIIAPMNLTNGYGQKHNIIFRLALGEHSSRSISKNESLVLSAFNFNNKDNGFYKIGSNLVSDPDSLIMGPFIYDITDNPHIPESVNFTPIKSLIGASYIVRRMSAGESPNYFITKNFKNFRQLTQVYPERAYNWYTSELHNWLSLDKTLLQGILYKPENFNPQKKYPIIFYYYENRSDALNAFLLPKSLDAGCAINIPFYTSNGYLVFCPDINYTIGDPMEGAFNAIISAANYASNLSYVDSKKMGVQGCSWGAIQTNYIVTHSALFAAACSASGLGNWISSYGGLAASGESMQGMYEYGQLRMGTTLWDKPSIYIKNSAVIAATNVSTPLLLMHTSGDEICPFPNIVEFFTALRRLGKKSWMLVYEGNHSIHGKDANDFSNRMRQFFDHYLKDKPAPKWMTRSLTNSQIGNNGLELDDSIRTPGAGLLKED